MNKSYQFVAELKHFKPRIWRRFVINADSTLADLGYLMIAMFEGTASHLFHFYKDLDVYYECAAYEDTGLESEFFRTVDARKVKIAEMFSEVGDKLNFEYDYGDSWEFAIKLEKIDQPVEAPKVLKGAGYGIVEDCGGVGGLDDIVELCKTRKGGAYEEFVAWSGLAKFDITQFDAKSLNEGLTEELKFIKRAYEVPN